MEYERIKYLIDKGISLDQIHFLLDISKARLKSQIELLNDPTSLDYDPEEYIRINAKIKENTIANNRKKMRIHSNFFELNANLLNGIKEGNISVEEVQSITGRPINSVLELVKSGHEKNPNLILKDYLIKYDCFSEAEKKKLVNKATDIQIEILCVCIFYQLTLDDIVLLFSTDKKDVENLFSLFPEYKGKIDYENGDKTKEEQNQNLKNARNYYLRRNEIVKLLNKARKK